MGNLRDNGHILEVEINAEGHKLAYMSPMDENGDADSGYRIAGPKAWGGSKQIARLVIDEHDLYRYITEHAPDLLKELRNIKWAY